MNSAMMGGAGKLLFLASVCALFAPGLGASSDHELVLIDAQVVDRIRDRAVPNLPRQAFEVLENGRPQPITVFEYERTPLDLVILGAAGDPRELEALGAARDGICEALRALREGDRVAVARLSPKGVAVEDPSTTREALCEGVLGSDLPPRTVHGVRLYDGIRGAAELLTRRFGYGPRRRAILLITNDRETGSKVTADQAIAAALRAGATVNALSLRTKVEPQATLPFPRLGPPTLRNRGVSWESARPVVEATGGETMWQDGDRSRCSALLEHIRARYLLGYPMPSVAKPEFRAITVRVAEPTRSNVEIRAPRGYYTRSATP